MTAAKLWDLICTCFRPPTLEEYIRSGSPRDHKELEELERKWIENRSFYNRLQ
jgi:hypothetical protein